MPFHKVPHRPNHDVTQTYDDGIVAIYNLSDSAEPGWTPKESRWKVYSLPYEERKLGIQRNYIAAQNQIKLERVIRVPAPPRPGIITSQQAAMTEDGVWYRIDLVQVIRSVHPQSLDLSLKLYTTGAFEIIDPGVLQPLEEGDTPHGG